MTIDEINVIKNMANSGFSIPAQYVEELIEYYEKELAASRESRVLSDVPSDADIHKKAVQIINSFSKIGNEDNNIDMWSFKKGAMWVIEEIKRRHIG